MKRVFCTVLALLMALSLAACAKNVKYEFDVDNPDDTIAVVNDMYFTVDTEKNEVTLFNYDGDSKRVRIPDTLNDIPVAGVASSAFADMPVTKIVFGEEVYFIESYAFQWTNLKSIEIPDTVTYLGNGVFFECEQLEEVAIPESVTTIGSNIFEGCPNKITVTVSDGSFAQDYCQELIENGADIEIKVK